VAEKGVRAKRTSDRGTIHSRKLRDHRAKNVSAPDRPPAGSGKGGVERVPIEVAYSFLTAEDMFAEPLGSNGE